MKIFIEIKNRDGGYEVEFVMHWKFPFLPRVGEGFWVEKFLTPQQIKNISEQIPEESEWDFDNNNGLAVEDILWTSQIYANAEKGCNPYLHKNIACVITLKET